MPISHRRRRLGGMVNSHDCSSLHCQCKGQRQILYQPLFNSVSKRKPATRRHPKTSSIGLWFCEEHPGFSMPPRHVKREHKFDERRHFRAANPSHQGGCSPILGKESLSCSWDGVPIQGNCTETTLYIYMMCTHVKRGEESKRTINPTLAIDSR